MINLDSSDKEFLIDVAEKFGLRSIEVTETSDIFSREIEEKIQESDVEMEGYYKHLHLMELSAELSDEARVNGPFRIIFSEGEIITERM